METARALFGSTWRSAPLLGGPLLQRLPDRSRMLVAGRSSPATYPQARPGELLVEATGPESLIIFACDRGRSPRAILRAVVLREWLGGLQVLLGVALVAWAFFRAP